MGLDHGKPMGLVLWCWLLGARLESKKGCLNDLCSRINGFITLRCYEFHTNLTSKLLIKVIVQKITTTTIKLWMEDVHKFILQKKKHVIQRFGNKVDNQ